MLSTTGGAGEKQESMIVGGRDQLLPSVLGGGDHCILHAFTCQEQMVRGGARHSFAWVPCNNQEVRGSERKVLEGETGGNEKGGEGRIPVEGASSLSQLSELVSTGRGR